MLLLINIAYAMEDCKSIMHKDDIPCLIISAYQYSGNCTNHTIMFYNSTPILLSERNMTDFGETGRCNATFNYSEIGSYTMNTSAGDSASIIVEDDENLTIAMVIGIGVICFLFMYFAFQLNNEQHFFLKILFIFFALATIIAIPGAIKVGETGNTYLTLLKITTWAFRVFVAYFCISIFWHWIQKSEKFMDFIDSLKRRP